MARELKPCGTLAAYHRHLYHGETPCGDCRRARREFVRRYRPLKELPPLQPCGTIAAEKRHRDYGEVPCEACKQAVRDYNRIQHAKRRAAKQAAA